MKSDRKITRRQFVGTAAATVALPTVIPASVLAKPGRPGANDRIVIANIGVGGMGSSHVPPDTAGLCDVDANQLNRIADRVMKSGKRTISTPPELYKDYRYILDRKDVDAVTIGTPDHWHAIMTVHACQAGKHVYSEKPTAKTIEEGRAMVNAARKYNRVVQIGAQGRSNPMAHKACEYVRNGMLGKVSRVEVWHPVNPAWPTGMSADPQTPPSTLDWNMWLGPARWADYHPQRCPGRFRWFMDYGGGFIRDRGNHALSIVSWLMDNDGYNGLIACEAKGKPFTEGLYDVPATMDVKWEFKNPDWTLTWSQPGTPNPRFPGEWGATYYGDRDSLVVIGGDGGCDTEPKAKSFEPTSGGVHVFLQPSTADPTQRHRENWLECIRTGKRPAMDVEIGRRVVILCILGNISYLLGRKVTFDMANERFVGDEVADRMISEPYRSPWKV